MLKDVYTGHQGLIFTCKFISNVKFATGSADRTIKIWDLYNRNCKIVYKIVNVIVLFLKAFKLCLLDQHVMI